MSRPNDARALRSREALQSALLVLIERKPLEQISIREITKEAHVSYPVFFRRYNSKQELLDDIAAEEVNNLLKLCLPAFQSSNRFSSLELLCQYVQRNRALWRALLTGGASHVMRQEFIRRAREIGETYEAENPWLPVGLAASYTVNGLFEILLWWLQQDGYPIVNVINLIDVLVVRPTIPPADVKLI